MRLVTKRIRTAFGGVATLLLFATTAVAEPITLVALGDSLTAGYGLKPAEAFPVQLEAALRARGHDVVVQNAGVSGDTATSGLARLDWALSPEADGVIVELGANDMLRGIDPRETRKALDTIMARLDERELPVLVAGMMAAPNLGPDFGHAFNAIYPDLATSYDALLYPFFLDGVAGDTALNLPDGIHPTAEGIGIIVSRILPKVEELIDRIESTR